MHAGSCLWLWWPSNSVSCQLIFNWINNVWEKLKHDAETLLFSKKTTFALSQNFLVSFSLKCAYYIRFGRPNTHKFTAYHSKYIQAFVAHWNVHESWHTVSVKVTRNSIYTICPLSLNFCNDHTVDIQNPKRCYFKFNPQRKVSIHELVWRCKDNSFILYCGN